MVKVRVPQLQLSPVPPLQLRQAPLMLMAPLMPPLRPWALQTPLARAPPRARVLARRASPRGRRTGYRAERATGPRRAWPSRSRGGARLRRPARPWRWPSCNLATAARLLVLGARAQARARARAQAWAQVWVQARADAWAQARVQGRCCAPVSALLSTHGCMPTAVTDGGPGPAQIRACSRDTRGSVTPHGPAVRPSNSWVVVVSSCRRGRLR